MQDIRNKSLAVITAECSINAENDMVRGLCRAAKKAGWNLFIFDALSTSWKDGQTVLETSIFSLLNFDSVSGVFITQNVMNIPELREDILQKCRNHNLPVISLGYKTPDCHSVIYENADYIEQIVDHVIEKHGCRTLNLVAGLENNVFSENRIKAFKKSLKKHGIAFDRKRMFYGQFWEIPTKEGVEKFLASGLPLPDAFICCNDVMAMAVCEVLQEKGITVPDDVIVTGYDGIEFERYSNPRLTTAKCSYETLGETGFEAMVKLVQKKKVPKIQKLIPTLVFTESCGCKHRTISGTKNLALKAMNATGTLRFMNSLYHRLTITADHSNTMEQFRRELPGKGFYDPDCWVLLNHNYTLPDSGTNYTSKNPYSDFVDCFIVSRSYEHYYDIPPIRHKVYIPDLREILNSGITNLLFMNLSCGEENIGYIVSPFDEKNFSTSGKEFFSMGLSQGLSSIKYRSQLEYMTVKDLLTGILNRRGFFNEITARVNEAMKPESGKHNLIIFSIDMDELKYINDTFGHKEGDAAIRKMAAIISKTSGPDAINSRFGGDEFVSAIITKKNPEKTINDFREKLVTAFTETNERSGKPYRIQASLGAKSTVITPKTKIEQVIAKADEMMYTDKTSKKRSHPRK